MTLLQPVTDIYAGNNARPPGHEPMDPRPPLHKLRVGPLREMCAQRGYEEALGNGRTVNGDSTGWSKDQCIKVLEANVTSGVQTRSLNESHRQKKLDEYDRFDLLAALRGIAVTPAPGMDDASLRALYRAKLAELDGAPVPAAPVVQATITSTAILSGAPSVAPAAVAAIDPSTLTVEKLKDMQHNDLKKVAASLGLKALPGFKRPELMALINAKLGH